MIGVLRWVVAEPQFNRIDVAPRINVCEIIRSEYFDREELSVGIEVAAGITHEDVVVLRPREEIVVPGGLIDVLHESRVIRLVDVGQGGDRCGSR